jgi:hypothetical protein
MKTYFIDTETCGLHGVPVLLQYAIDDGPVHLVHLWTTPINDLLVLIEDMVDNRVVAHNLRFDWFHLSKFYNMLTRHVSYDPKVKTLMDWVRVSGWEWPAQVEMWTPQGACLKPRAAVDTWLLASQSESQSYLMDAKQVRVRRIPVGIAKPLCNELNVRTELPWILFANKKSKKDVRWEIVDHEDRETGNIDPAWKDIKIDFAPSKGLKDLAVFLCGHEQPARFDEIACSALPAEEGYAPFAMLLSSKDRDWLYNGCPTWPAVIEQHIEHWATNEDAQAYAEDDILMLRKLYQYFGSPKEDRDSMLACQVASVRLHGFKIDLEKTYRLLKESNAIIGTAELNVNSPKQVEAYVWAALDDTERLGYTEGFNQKVIDEIKKEYSLKEIEGCDCDSGFIRDTGDETSRSCCRCGGRGEVGPTGSCETCNGSGKSEELDEDGKPKKCKRCDGTGLSDDRKMPVVLRVEHVERIRKHTKRVELFHKLLLAKRAYPDFNVIGTKSGRMSGASGLNFQGIDHSKEVRSIFTLADGGLVLSAGDYSSQELAIAATVMQDEDLMNDMEAGKKLHGLFAAEAFETTYEDIMADQDDGRYGKGKGGVFAILYGGQFETVAKNMGIEVKAAEAAYNRMIKKYPRMGYTRKKVAERFSSMKQNEDGKIEYRDPPEKFIESVFGFRRHFDTEYALQRMILDVIKNMPEAWKKIDLKVQRKEGKLQSMSGAICSALYGAAFSLQNKVIRASNNHKIQSTGRELTIGMQATVWGLQPQGIHPFKLTLMSIHDELAVVSRPETCDEIRRVIEEKVEEQREAIPLTSIEWFTGNKSWAETKDDEKEGVVLGWNPKASND